MRCGGGFALIWLDAPQAGWKKFMRWPWWWAAKFNYLRRRAILWCTYYDNDDGDGISIRTLPRTHLSKITRLPKSWLLCLVQQIMLPCKLFKIITANGGLTALVSIDIYWTDKMSPWCSLVVSSSTYSYELSSFHLKSLTLDATSILSVAHRSVVWSLLLGDL